MLENIFKQCQQLPLVMEVHFIFINVLCTNNCWQHAVWAENRENINGDQVRTIERFVNSADALFTEWRKPEGF